MSERRELFCLQDVSAFIAGADRKRDHKLVQEHFEELEEGSDADDADEEDKPDSPPESEGDSDNDLIGLPSNAPSSDKPKDFSDRIARPARPGQKLSALCAQ